MVKKSKQTVYAYLYEYCQYHCSSKIVKLPWFLWICFLC